MGGKVPEYNLEKEEWYNYDQSHDDLNKKFLLSSFSEDAQKLRTDFPPRLASAHKRFLDSHQSKSAQWVGKVHFSRFSEMNLPKAFGRYPDVKHVVSEDVFTYERDENGDDKIDVVWHVNFADRALFGYYGGGLFAQDEIQTAEMPILASVREYLQNVGEGELKPETRNGDFSSPCLIRNVQRRVTVKMDKNKEEGRPFGLYGNQFSRAPLESIKKATVLFEKPQLENILAMEAPKNQHGEYTKNTIIFILKTAFTGFLSARIESVKEKGEKARTIIHTGNWGTGAYGGHKMLMALLQIAAAHLAGIDELHFHSFSKIYTDAYRKAKEMFDNMMKEEKDMDVIKFIDFVFVQGFRWGVSDGN